MVTAPDTRVDPQPSHARRWLTRAGQVVGGVVAAIGVAVVITEIATWRRLHGASFDRPFIAAMAVALTLWLLLRRHASLKARPVAAALTDAVKTALLFALVFLVIFNVFADFAYGRERVYRASMKSDLRNLDVVETASRTKSGKYITNVEGLMTPSLGLKPPEITLSSDGWSATMNHVETAQRCAIYTGIPPAELAQNNEGEPTCLFTGSPYRWKATLQALATIVGGLVLGTVMGLSARGRMIP